MREGRKTAARWTLAAVMILSAASLYGIQTGRAAADQPASDPDSMMGIGAVLARQGVYPTVMGIVKGGPADRDGRLKVKDRIAGVAQGDGAFIDCANMTVNDVGQLIRGRKGTTVCLSVIPSGAADASKREFITLIRAEILVTPQGLAAAPVPAATPAASGSAAPPTAVAQSPGELFGIGIVLGADGDYPVVASVAISGAAGLDGHLKPNDHITGVAEGDGPFVDCKGKDVHTVITMTRGKAGSTVRLQVLPAGSTDPSRREVIALRRAHLNNITELTPGQETRLAGEIQKLTEAERKVMTGDMDKLVRQVAGTAGLNVTGSAALDFGAAAAVDQCMQKSERQIKGMVEGALQARTSEQREMVFRQIDADPEESARGLEAQEDIRPDEMPAWQTALKQTLTPAQAAAWAGVLAKQRQNVDDEIRSYVNRSVAFETQLEQRLLDPAAASVETELNLPQDRLDKVEALEKSVIAKFADKARVAIRNRLEEMSESNRKEIVASRGIMSTVAPATTGWDDGLAKLLTTGEMQHLKDAKENRANLRAAAAGKLLVALLDEKIAFTDAQRRQLEPIAGREVRKQSSLLADRSANVFFSSQTSVFNQAASSAPEDEIKAILDSIQWKHWQEFSALKDQEDTSNQVNQIQLPSADDAKEPQPVMEPEAAESAISDYLADKGAAERRSVLASVTLAAEDAARVAHLTDKAEDRLMTAARGYAEYYLNNWNMLTDQLVHSQTANASPDTIKQTLAGIQSYPFQNIPDFAPCGPELSGSGPDYESVWDNAVKSVLSPDQLKAWKQETEERKAFRDSAVAAYIVSIFDETTALSAEQWSKLEPMVANAIGKYGGEFDGFVNGSSTHWYMEGFLAYVPIVAIGDTDLKTVLTTEQLNRWRGTQQCSIAMSYWSNMVANRQMAVRRLTVKAKP